MKRELSVLFFVATFGWWAHGVAGAVEPPDGTVLVERILALDQGGNNADEILAVAAYPGNRVLVAGRASVGTGTTMFVVRYLQSGALDPSFGSGGVAIAPFGLCTGCDIVALAVLADSKIIVGGTADYGNGSADFLVGKLRESGVPDTSFGINGVAQFGFGGLGGNHHLADLAIDPYDGRIVVVGTTAWDQVDSNWAIARLLPNGEFDTSFSADGKIVLDFTGAYTDIARAVALDRSGKLYVAGSSWRQDGIGGPWSYDFALAHIDWNGNLESCFGIGGRKIITLNLGGSLNDHAFAIAQSGQSVYVAGEAATGPLAGNKAWAVAKLHSGCGFEDFSFGTNGKVTGTFGCAGCGVADSARAVVPQGDGKVLLAGWGYEAGQHLFGVARLSSEDGDLDPEFAGGAGSMLWDISWGIGSGDDDAFAAALAGGRILVAGKTEWSGFDTDLAWLLLANSYIFADGFDSGGPNAWQP